MRDLAPHRHAIGALSAVWRNVTGMTVEMLHDPETEGPPRTPVDGVNVIGSLSPSRAADFMSCPLLYRFRVIDQIPEAPDAMAARGTLVHAVLERLFDLPAGQRTLEEAAALLRPQWDQLVAAEPDVAELFDDADGLAQWLEEARSLLETYFRLEDPRRLEPAERELYVEHVLDSKLLVRGYVDRLDVNRDGLIRVVDYKGLAVDTPLPTPSGWTTMGEIQEGEDLLGRDGRPSRVMRKSGIHQRPCYRVRFDDGSSVVCDNVHLWAITESHRQSQTRRTVDTDTLAVVLDERRKSGTPRSVWVESGDALQLEDVAELPVDPWLLGVWLGDGHSRGGQISVGKADISDMLVLLKERWARKVSVAEERSGFTVSLSKLDDRCAYGHGEFHDPTPRHPTRRCAHESRHVGMTAWNVSFAAELRRARVLDDKHIPPEYLRAGHQQRIDLVRGLMDTDGWWNKARRRAGFTTTDDRLASDVIELLRTLGIHPSHFTKPYANAVRPGRTWHVIEFTPVGFIPFSLPRKAIPAANGVTELQSTLACRRIITAVDPVESVPTQCVAVDAPDSLYLCGDGFIPTHNTGRSPSEYFEAKALFQMKFYALTLWRSRGRIPSLLQLIYLGNEEILCYEPDEADLLATERKVNALWAAISRATESGDWRPHKSALCDWCDHKSRCPEWGGTPPPLPESAAAMTAPVSGE
jgi:RecB family exonuclease